MESQRKQDISQQEKWKCENVQHDFSPPPPLSWLTKQEKSANKK